MSIIGKKIYLHASAKMDTMAGKVAASRMAGFKLSTVVDNMPLGAIVATADILGWYTREDDFLTLGSNINIPAMRKNKWYMGGVGWVLANIEKLPEPIPYKGALGLWSYQPPNCKHCQIPMKWGKVLNNLLASGGDTPYHLPFDGQKEWLEGDGWLGEASDFYLCPKHKRALVGGNDA